MFQQLAQQLEASEWGRRIKDNEGVARDPGVQEFVEYFIACLRSMNEINIDKPIVVNNTSAGPAFTVNNIGGDARAIQINLANGQNGSLGIGLGNKGVVANEVVPLPHYYLRQDIVNITLNTTGENGGVTTTEPPNIFLRRPPNTGGTGGAGELPDGVPNTDVGGTCNKPGGGTVGSGYTVYPAQGMMPRYREVGSGGGPGSLGLPGIQAREGADFKSGGGGATCRRGEYEGRGVYPGQTDVPVVTQPLIVILIEIVNLTTDGYTGTVDVVTNVECVAGEIVVTTKTMTFKKGILTNVA